MSNKKITLVLSILIAIFFINSSLRAQEKKEDVTASVSCTSLGTVNGVVTYQYDVTLKNNTSDKLKIEYKVLFKAGDVIKKQHSHSTIAIPDEELKETNTNTMDESDWDQVTRCWVEWTATKL